MADNRPPRGREPLAPAVEAAPYSWRRTHNRDPARHRRGRAKRRTDPGVRRTADVQRPPAQSGGRGAEPGTQEPGPNTRPPYGDATPARSDRRGTAEGRAAAGLAGLGACGHGLADLIGGGGRGTAAGRAAEQLARGATPEQRLDDQPERTTEHGERPPGRRRRRSGARARGRRAGGGAAPGTRGRGRRGARRKLRTPPARPGQDARTAQPERAAHERTSARPYGERGERRRLPSRPARPYGGRSAVEAATVRRPSRRRTAHGGAAGAREVAVRQSGGQWQQHDRRTAERQFGGRAGRASSPARSGNRRRARQRGPLRSGETGPTRGDGRQPSGSRARGRTASAANDPDARRPRWHGPTAGGGGGQRGRYDQPQSAGAHLGPNGDGGRGRDTRPDALRQRTGRPHPRSPGSHAQRRTAASPATVRRNGRQQAADSRLPRRGDEPRHGRWRRRRTAGDGRTAAPQRGSAAPAQRQAAERRPRPYSGQRGGGRRATPARPRYEAAGVDAGATPPTRVDAARPRRAATPYGDLGRRPCDERRIAAGSRRAAAAGKVGGATPGRLTCWRLRRGVAQMARAPVSKTGCRRFNSCHPCQGSSAAPPPIRCGCCCVVGGAGSGPQQVPQEVDRLASNLPSRDHLTVVGQHRTQSPTGFRRGGHMEPPGHGHLAGTGPGGLDSDPDRIVHRYPLHPGPSLPGEPPPARLVHVPCWVAQGVSATAAVTAVRRTRSYGRGPRARSVTRSAAHAGPVPSRRAAGRPPAAPAGPTGGRPAPVRPGAPRRGEGAGPR